MERNISLPDLSYVDSKVTAAHNANLLSPFSFEEFSIAVQQMHPDKSPEPDGFNLAFFQHFWPLIGKEIFHACSSWLNNNEFPASLNETIIVLIPKNDNPVSMRDLRPIALYNVVVAFELIHYMKRKTHGKVGDVALKIDISKAYDRIRWDYLKAIMLRMGFDSKWMEWIILCVSIVSYSVSVNGELVGPFYPGRELRQGDPLSPYLFIICAEGLSSLIKQAERRGDIHGCRICRGAPRISHLLFVDDSFFFFRADAVESSTMHTIFAKYESNSGQAINFQKSGWQSKLLSQAGKEILIKAVGQAIPSYCMSTFLLPISLSEELQKMMNSFWWGPKSDGGRRINWLSWDKLCLRKEEGGLGFRNLRDFNLAMLGKQGWNLITKPDSLIARLLKARYYRSGDFLSARLGHNPSFTWKGIWSSRAILLKGSRWRIGDDCSIDVWNNPWLRDAENFKVETPIMHDLAHLKVHDLWIHDSIASIPLSSKSPPDSLIWHWDNHGNYTVKSGYRIARWLSLHGNLSSRPIAWNMLWDLSIPPKIKLCLWRACKGCLPTRSALYARVSTSLSFLKDWLDARLGSDQKLFNGNANTQVVNGVSSPKEAEALGLREAARWLLELRVSNVIVELDAKGDYDAFYSKALDRQANAAADALAKAASSFASPSFWRDAPPLLGAILASDVSISSH
ncbi:putative mitochondrial protein [Vitis vinifera]|uniref:Putative mitochondrial protein n=1 Tax=Vitis vinifera TaxID=29760 RepID=A0A438KR71_VITVI|nr:putative mitochondrial protein [Vitis vinifera]